MSKAVKPASIVVCILAVSASAAPVTNVTVRAAANSAEKGGSVTFGQVFKRGDVKQGVLVSAPGASAQADVKRKYEDGSARFAIVSVMVPKWPPEMTVALSDGVPDSSAKSMPVRAADLLKTDFDATVTLRLSDGAERSASARKLLAAAEANARTWLEGPVATEWLLDGPLAGKDGQADPDLRVQFQVRAYAGCKAVRVSVVLENCLDTWAGNIGYDVAVTLGKEGKLAYAKKGVDHRRLSRWRKVFWWPGPPAKVDVAHEPAYLSASGALPNYDRSITIPEKALAAMAARWAHSRETDIMGSGSLTKYMPTTGGRPEIGPYPSWTVRYLLSMDPRAKAVVLGNGDLAGSWPIHVRNARTGRIMTLDERPEFWLDARGKDKPTWQADRKAPPPRRTADGRAHPYHLSPDVAHVGSYAYVPYLVTGDFYYLEEAYFWANYGLLAQWPVPRGSGKGILSGQVRGKAWGLRNVADAATIAPDGHPEAEYFRRMARNNLAEMTAKMYGPPEYNKMGFWGIRTVADARIHDAANPRWMITAPWEHDFLIWSLHHLTELGYAEAAKPRDFELRWRVGAFVHPDKYDPLLAAPYRMVVGEMQPDKEVVFYEDWKKLGRENAKLTKATRRGRPKLDYDYSAYLALVCAVDAGTPKGADALKVLLDITGGFHGILADPAWRIVPRRAAKPGR